MIRKLLLLLFVFVCVCKPAISQALSDPGMWENDIRKFEHLDSSETYSPEALLFVGSSSIRLWNTIEDDMAPWQVIRRGFGGSKLSDLKVYVRRIVSPHLCRAIILFIANDISGNDDDITPEEVAALFGQVVDTIRATHPHTPVFWIEITPTPSRWHVWEKASLANQLIENICSPDSNTFFISTRQFFLDDSGLPISEFFLQDMLHLNEKGYKVWTGIIKNELEKVL